MALPRRVPWTSQEEYEEVFGLLFASNGDLNAQRRAVDRVRDLEEAFALIAKLSGLQWLAGGLLTPCNLIPSLHSPDTCLAVSRMLSLRCRGHCIHSGGHHERRFGRESIDLCISRGAQTCLFNVIDSVSDYSCPRVDASSGALEHENCCPSFLTFLHLVPPTLSLKKLRQWTR